MAKGFAMPKNPAKVQEDVLIAPEIDMMNMSALLNVSSVNLLNEKK